MAIGAWDILILVERSRVSYYHIYGICYKFILKYKLIKV